MSYKEVPEETLNDVFASLDKMKIEEDDILVLKGKFTFDELQAFVAALKHRHKNNIIICLSNDTSIETMKESDVELILTNLNKKRKNEASKTTKID